jgi:signal transduction histidine kinase
MRHASREYGENKIALDQFLRAVRESADRNEFCSLVAARLRALVNCERAVLLVRDAQTNSYAESPPTESAQSGEFGFAAGGRFARWLEVNDRCLPIPDAEGVVAYLDDADRAHLAAIHTRLCVPLCAADGLVAILLLCDERSDWRSDVRVDVVLQYARQAAAGYEARQETSAAHSAPIMHRAEQLIVAGQLAAAIAHEVRNPLSTIRLGLQYVLNSATPWARKAEFLSEMVAEVDRIDETITQMLTLSRPRAVERVRMDLIEIVSDSLRLIRPYVDRQGIRVEMDVKVALAVSVDPGELRQVCLNLLLNACQAMPQGGRLTVRAFRHERDALDATREAFCTVEFADTGPGIPAAQLTKIFDPFYTTKQGGTGLGLPVCLSIVKRLGGDLRLRCPTDGGTVASIVLPLLVDE